MSINECCLPTVSQNAFQEAIGEVYDSLLIQPLRQRLFNIFLFQKFSFQIKKQQNINMNNLEVEKDQQFNDNSISYQNHLQQQLHKNQLKCLKAMAIVFLALILTSLFLTGLSMLSQTVYFIILDNQSGSISQMQSFYLNCQRNKTKSLNYLFLLYFDPGYNISTRLKEYFQVYFLKDGYPFNFEYIQRILHFSLMNKYFFLTATHFYMDNLSFIPEMVEMIESQPNISAVYLSNKRYNFTYNYFSFTPGLYKIEHFKQYPFRKIVGRSNFFTEENSRKILQYYQTQGFKVLFKNYQGFGMKEKSVMRSSNPKTNIDLVQKFKAILEDAEPVLGLQDYLIQIKQLPFCLVVTEKDQNLKQPILKSIQNLDYSNYFIIESPEDFSYIGLKSLMKQKCLNNSYVYFVSHPILPKSLKQLNQLHQQHVSWVTYSTTKSVKGQAIQIYSFLFRVYDLLQLKDFDKSNSLYLKNGNKQIQAIGILQLCLDSNKPIDRTKITKSQQISYLSIVSNNNSLPIRTVYNVINSLTEDGFRDHKLNQVLNRIKKKIRSSKKILNFVNQMVKKSIDRKQQIFLPSNHSIFDVEKLYFDKKYGIIEKRANNQQIRFCVTILSHNNIQDGRYWKIIQSIILQEYENYHIVFIDDNSSDGNMEKTIEYFKKINFPRSRLTFIQNKVRAFATYNIINAAYNFCKKDQVQMILDGDDQVIGKYAFQVLSSAYYQNGQIWVAYSNYKSNQYQNGLSMQVKYQSDYLENNKRRIVSYIGAIRTWRVQLIHTIPGSSHKFNGQWLKTLYDDALQHPILELSTPKRVKYIEQVLYEYNVNYGDNDDSNIGKILFRDKVHLDISKRKPLKPIEKLGQNNKDIQIQKQLKRDRSQKYFVIQ